ncbi:MAG: hypothetical protein R2697_03750 [Ilumatobacteraceae bacterium]
MQTINGTPSRALVIADLAHVIWAANMGVLGLHVWQYTADKPQWSDELRIDLDPSPARISTTSARRRCSCGSTSPSMASGRTPRRPAARACTST